jgi:hypothetical protein
LSIVRVGVVEEELRKSDEGGQGSEEGYAEVHDVGLSACLFMSATKRPCKLKLRRRDRKDEKIRSDFFILRDAMDANVCPV